jgi:hypothetical protein
MDVISNSLSTYTFPTMPILSWRTVAVVFVLANLKSLPFMWSVSRPPTTQSV